MADYGKPSKKLSANEQAAIVKEAREFIEDSWTHDRDNRRDSASDLSFLAGNQWPDAIRREREAANRPMLTFNRLPQFVRQVTNDIRQAEFSIKVAPEDDGSDPELARIYDGLIRQIQYQSSARHVYAQAAEHQASCGIGWFRICCEYPDDSAFNQEIRIKGIRNPLSVYDDAGAVEPDRSDAMKRAIVEVWPKKAFKAKWPKAQDVSVDVPTNDNTNDGAFFWATTDTVRVAEYWRKVPVKKTIALLSSGETIDITGKGEAELGYFPIERTREVESHRIESYIVSGSEVLSGPSEHPGSYFPIVPVIGGEFPLENRTYRYGVIRFARDPQQLYNFYRTATAEAIALAPKAPYVATADQIGPYKQMWDTSHTTNRPYLLYKPDPNAPGTKPQREAPPALPAALMQEAQIASDDMKNVTGIHDAALGKQSNETSGVAIGRRQMESDVANYHFADNLHRALEYAGRVLIDLIPKIYDNERVIRLMGESDDTKEEFVPINRVVMGMDGVPVTMNDLSAARFDVRVKVGKSYTTRRAEAADSLLQFVGAVPAAGQVAGDLIAKNFDWPGADELAKRLRNLVPPQVLVDPKKPETQPPPDPIAQQMQELQMRGAQAEVAKLNAEVENKRIDSVVKMMGAMLPPEAVVQTFPMPFPDTMPPSMPDQPAMPPNMPPEISGGDIDSAALAQMMGQPQPMPPPG